MKISYDDVRDYCNELHLLASKMQDNFNEIKSLGTTVEAKGIWNSPASNNYQTKINNLVNNFDEAFRELETSILFMAKISEGYQAIDANIMGEICNNLNIMEPTLDISRIYTGL